MKIRMVLAVFGFLGVTGTVFSGELVDLLKDNALEAWTRGDGQPPKAGWTVKDGQLSCVPKKGGYIWTREDFGDFVLDLEFKTAGNSGVFVRTGTPGNPVQTGIEIQVDHPSEPGTHSVGAFYDLQAPSKCTAVRDAWNRMRITARGAEMVVEINGEEINRIDLDRWTTPGKNPDGSKNKYRQAARDFPRSGRIGFQDHGAPVIYRKVQVKRL